MKKLLVLLMTVFLHRVVFAQYVNRGLFLEERTLSPPFTTSNDVIVIPPWSHYDFVVLNRTLFFFNLLSKTPVIIGDDLLLDENKYFTFEWCGNKHVFIGGGDVFIYDQLPYFGNMFPSWMKEFPPKLSERPEIPLMNVFWFWEDGVKSITASSVLRGRTARGEVLYDESQLRQTFFGYGDSPIGFNSFKRAWAEGVPGDGIGESLTIDFSIATDHMMVLNGYVNLRRMDLYTANNRLKNVLIKSDEPMFSIEYNFDDVVKFSEIEFPQKTKHVTMVIRDVYKGLKYDDTCITSVFLKQQSGFKVHEYYRLMVKGSVEYEKKIDAIETELKKRGYLE